MLNQFFCYISKISRILLLSRQCRYALSDAYVWEPKQSSTALPQ